MASLFSDLRFKEVIDLHSGQRLGYIYDAEIDPVEGRILSLMIPGPGRAGGLLGRDDDYVLPWNQISRMGDDIILVDLENAPPRRKREKRQIFY
jgi:YlmC/YmxH family sporulation protein